MSDIFRIIIAGDTFPRKAQDRFSAGKADSIFDQRIIELFSGADLTVCNLEGVLSSSDKAIDKCGPHVKAPAETVNGLCALGVDMVTLANNHITDYGMEGYIDTCKALDDAGIAYFGAGKDTADISTHKTVFASGKKVTFYGVSETVFNIPGPDSPGANLYDEYIVCKEIEKLKKDSDLLIVLYHGGVEYYQYPTPWIRKRFYRMAESGADIVISQHTHCVGAEEHLGEKYLLYGQGNFFFPQTTPNTNSGILLELCLGDSGYTITKHRVELNGDRVSYISDDVDEGFVERSCKLAEGVDISASFSKYSKAWTIKWLLQFRGHTLKDRILRKILGNDRFAAYLRKSYGDNTILRIIEHMRGEEDIEVLQRGLEDLFNSGR